MVRGGRVCRARSDVAQHNFARTPPANRQEIAHAAADHESRRPTLMTQEAIRVEKSTREKTVSILAHDDLAAVEVSGQDQVIAAIAARLPDPWVMRAQDPDVRREGV